MKPLSPTPLCLASADAASFFAFHQLSTAPLTFKKDNQSFFQPVPRGGGD